MSAHRILTGFVLLCGQISAQSASAQEACAFKTAFVRSNKGADITVYEGKSDPGAGGAAPLAFIVPYLNVNTDGTRISYKVDDPYAKHGAINNIGNALREGQSVGAFRKIAANDWQPVSRTWQILDSQIIEMDKKTHKPCADAAGYLVSMTSVPAEANARAHEGDCRQEKWLDALTVPALVLPKPKRVAGRVLPTEFDIRGATGRSIVALISLSVPERVVVGIVGDKGPVNELGESSVAMNAKLNGLPDGSKPTSASDADRRFEVEGAAVLIFPGKTNWAKFPLTPASVNKQAEKRFEAWGGMKRFRYCLHDLEPNKK